MVHRGYILGYYPILVALFFSLNNKQYHHRISLIVTTSTFTHTHYAHFTRQIMKTATRTIPAAHQIKSAVLQWRRFQFYITDFVAMTWSFITHVHPCS